jgi:hypothetical protein
MGFCRVDGFETVNDRDKKQLWYLHTPAAGLICAEDSTPIFKAWGLFFLAGVAWSHELAYW